MIKMGTQGISALRLGTQRIKKAYLGEVLILGTEKAPSRLPDGYTEVEYISFTGYASIATGVSPSFSAGRYVFDAEFGIFSQASRVIGSASTTGSPVKNFYITTYGSAKIIYAYNYGSGTYANVGTTRGRLLIDWDFLNGELHFGDTTISTTPVSGTTSKPVYFAVPTTGGKMYSAQIYTSGAIKRDFVPCIDPSDVVGMYDIVNGKFYVPTETASAGPAV